MGLFRMVGYSKVWGEALANRVIQGLLAPESYERVIRGEPEKQRFPAHGTAT